MLNNAWPSMIWHLYDWYLRPGGGYFGTKKACEPVHVLYSYDDRSIVVVNGTQRRVTGRGWSSRAESRSTTKCSVEAGHDRRGADARRACSRCRRSRRCRPAYFVDLRLTDAGGSAISTNLYWLGTKTDDSTGRSPRGTARR